ncbi:protein arginine N-methyltransferase 3 [Elysia marginata]|uniref:type I protein arginine methyltransferase n=1 Tax=Elysia marginata TaxID=1093978 RepID=A0AAV4GQ53_9GAST|nr:protein arginine N-methyltransferase 3 [Elysia marginata]
MSKRLSTVNNMATFDEDADVPDLDSGSESDCEDERDWEEIEDGDSDGQEDEFHPLQGTVRCLFSNETLHSVEELLLRSKKCFNFDLVEACTVAGMDCISYIKMINFIRLEILHFDYQGQYKVELMVKDIESAITSPTTKMLASSSDNSSYLNHTSTALRAIGEGATGDGLKESEAVHALICSMQQVETERDFLREELSRALEQIEKLKIAGQEMLLRSSDNPISSKSEKLRSQSSSLSEEDGYFASYTHHDIHMTMLKDKVRTESYRDFMLKNPQLFEGKTMLDVGCGTGILSMFAVQAGASQVVAVDQSNIIYQAMDIARENGMHEKITFVKGRLEDVELPIQKFDIIVSEWMGYFLLFEAMLDSVLWARDRYLTPGGCVYPDHFSMKVVGMSDPELRKSKLEFWDDVYGFKMSCMKSSVSDEVNVRLVKDDLIITEPSVIKDLDVMQCTVSELDFTCEFSLKCKADGEITALVGYFDTDFIRGCTTKVNFSTGPEATPTHWEQAVMMLPTPVTVQKGKLRLC